MDLGRRKMVGINSGVHLPIYSKCLQYLPAEWKMRACNIVFFVRNLFVLTMFANFMSCGLWCTLLCRCQYSTVQKGSRRERPPGHLCLYVCFSQRKRRCKLTKTL
jgi:hypothetical protein